MISINMLPDDVLLEMFKIYCEDEGEDIPTTKYAMEAWMALVHVCRRWRGVVFGSPHYLGLRLVCLSETPVRALLDVWPVLPLSILGEGPYPTETLDNIIAALERSDRVDDIELVGLDNSSLKKVSAAMQKPFPRLTYLRLDSLDSGETVPVLPDLFLGGSVPRLRSLYFHRISFPGLPKLLLSATQLVRLDLTDSPHSGYFSPEEIFTALSTSIILESLSLKFLSHQSSPERENRYMRPQSRTILPSLACFSFKGVSEYLEALVAHIDFPRLNRLNITFFNDIIFDTPQFLKFICHTPALKTLNKAEVVFENLASRVKLSSSISSHGELNLKILCRELDWQVSSLEQVFSSLGSSIPPISTLEYLYINEKPFPKPIWQDNVEIALWLEFLHPFTALTNLYLSEKFVPHIALALAGDDGTTELLPTLQNIYLDWFQPSGPVHEAIGKFVATRQVTIHPLQNVSGTAIG